MPQDSTLDISSVITERVREKKESYRRYNFERLQEEAFATFFDLAQEYTNLANFYQICVTVPKEFFGLESRLYVIHPKTLRLEKVCTSEEGLVPSGEKLRFGNIELTEVPCETQAAWLFPIRGNQALTQWLSSLSQTRVIGMFEIYPKEKVDSKEHFFLEKFTNRIGYNLHQKLLIQQNIDHIKFINQLVSDIEHNVISPNMYYKLFLIRLKKGLSAYRQVQEQLGESISSIKKQNEPIAKELDRIYQALRQNNQMLGEEWEALSKHYEHTSLFLETLLRREHFEKGAYVLRRQPCNFRTEIIKPLLERYLPLLEKKGIRVENRLESVPDEQVTLFVDKGLISQVFDNFFSNALKYTREMKDQLGHVIRFISYNRQILRDFFGEGIHGMRFNFFTTGRPLSEEEARKVFQEGYRASSAGRERGSGHGLHFVRNVVEIHGGRVGCEPQQYGNLFYFILPWKEDKSVGE